MEVSFTLFLLQVLNGLALGVLYLLIASGLSVIFGMTDIINFAHGALYMLGAYVGLTVVGATGNFWIALLIAPAVVGVFGAIMERTTLHRIYDRDPLYHIILTFGLTLMIGEAIVLIWGKGPQQFATPELLSGALILPSLGFAYPKYKLFIIVGGLAVAALVWALFEFTEFGLIIRAGAQRPDTTRILGINISKYFTLVFALAAVLAGVAGVFAGPFQNVTPTMDKSVIIVAFITVVVGGLGSFRGSAVAAILIGLVTSLGAVFVPELSGYTIYLLMIAILLVRPQGLLGEYKVRSESTKVEFGEIIDPVRLSDKRVWVVLGILALVPLGTGIAYSSYYVGLLSLMFVWALLALSLDIVMGYMGLLSFGHAAFFGIGAYATALLAIHVQNSFLLAIVVSAVLCGAVAWVIGALSIRLTGVYFAMITLAFAEMFHQIALTSEFTGGDNGLSNMPAMSLLGIDLGDTTTFYYVALVTVVGIYALSVRILDSPFGRSMTAIRESERRMSFLGYDVNKYKRRAFTLSGAIGGVAGALLATYQVFVSPSTLEWIVSGDAVVAMMFGGIGTLFGPMIGAGVFVGLKEVLSSSFEQWRLVLGGLLVLVVMFAPRGLVSVYGVVRDLVPGLSPRTVGDDGRDTAPSSGGEEK